MNRILLVDDDSSLRGVIQFALEEEGYEVEVAEDGKEALIAYKRSRPSDGAANQPHQVVETEGLGSDGVHSVVVCSIDCLLCQGGKIIDVNRLQLVAPVAGDQHDWKSSH